MAEPLIETLAALPAALTEKAVRALSDASALTAARDFENWSHAGQRAPDCEWRTWVIKGGRGFGKTRAGAEYVAAAARARGGLRIALVGATVDEARRVMVEGESGLLAVASDALAAWEPSLRRLRFASGAEATLFSGAHPDGLRGAQHHLAWCDELAKWRRGQASWDNLQLGLRLADPVTGAAPRAIVTTTPRSGELLARILAAPGTIVTGGPTHENVHLSPTFYETVHALYAGTRLEQQELEGRLLPDAAGALWTEALIVRSRRAARGAAPGERVVIGVDPPVVDGTCGIVACAIADDGTAAVIADHSVTGRSPEGWARAVADAAAAHGAERVVAERNQGGKMVESVLRAADAGLPLAMVNATESKSARADPIALLFEAGKVVLAGRFPELEAELRGFVAGGGYEGPGESPDRADAMVWALTHGLLRGQRTPRVRAL